MSDPNALHTDAQEPNATSHSSGPPSLRLRALTSQQQLRPVIKDPIQKHKRGLEILVGIAISLTVILGYLVYTSVTGIQHLKAGITAAKAGETSRAIDELTRCIVGRGTPLIAYKYRAMAYGENGDHGLAVADYSKIIAAQPNNAEVYMQRGCQNLQNLNYPNASDDFTQVLKLQPNFIDAHRLRAAAEWKLKDYARVVEDCRAYLNTARTVPADHREAVLLLLAAACDQLGQRTEAIDACSQAISLSAGDPRPLQKRAYLLRAEDHLSEAIEDCTAALKIAPSADLFRLRALCYLSKGESAPAMEDLNEAIKLAPNDLNTRNKRAELALSTHNYGLALDDAKFTLTSLPTNREANSIYERVRKLTGADKLKVVSKDHLVQDVRTDLRWVGKDTSGETYRGYKLLIAGQDAEALIVLDGVVRAHPNDAVARKYLSHALLSRGQAGKAVEELRTAALSIGLLPEDLLALAQAAHLNGNQSASISSYEDYLAGQPTDKSARLALVEVLLNAGQTTKAQDVARKGIQLSQTEEDKALFARVIRERRLGVSSARSN